MGRLSTRLERLERQGRGGRRCPAGIGHTIATITLGPGDPTPEPVLPCQACGWPHSGVAQIVVELPADGGQAA